MSNGIADLSKRRADEPIAVRVTFRPTEPNSVPRYEDHALIRSGGRVKGWGFAGPSWLVLGDLESGGFELAYPTEIVAKVEWVYPDDAQAAPVEIPLPKAEGSWSGGEEG